ncbi:DUF1349 domain-containing protein [Sphingomonas sp. NSE70-1]|uniref:DUF1349 domain-containing protein n=1 Tax=Sphingomonas caseinilyticus TaxID=2908205 RepID=A0ABT0RQW8_9SPHN|nr:DUF1349 domain-containing protein [Sphingomonas caseinilyticus]MCL6697419.1 DUF1349 domain-containing protein [Sphingomonas caseinilyticus]
MKPVVLLGFSAFLIASAPASGQVTPPDPNSALIELSDEFDGPSLDSKWVRFDKEFGWPDKLKSIDVGRTVQGALNLQPYDSAWVRDVQAPFLFQRIHGDFDVRARVRVRSGKGPIAAGTWSLGGLMARVPNGLTEKDWEPRRENWHFITTGVGLEPGEPRIETKGTYNSYSSLKLRPVEPGWVELRLVRVGMTLFALARTDPNGSWEVRDRFYRMEPSPFMQVGLIAYTTSPDAKPVPENAAVSNRSVERSLPVDMVMDVDWIRFSRPAPKIEKAWQMQVQAHPLADPNLAEAEILKALGA